MTSGTRPLVQGWIDRLGLAQPTHLVTAEMVERGKPDPAAYLEGAKRLGLSLPPLAAGGTSSASKTTSTTTDKRGEQVLVLEDAPSGIRAGRAAGFRVVALATSHEVHELRDAGADWIVRDMRSVEFLGWEGGQAHIRLRNALRL